MHCHVVVVSNIRYEMSDIFCVIFFVVLCDCTTINKGGLT